jgi:transposase-like protein
MASQQKSKKQTSYDKKIEAVQEVLVNKRHKQEVAEELGIHLNSLTNWLRLYREKGADGLRPLEKQKATVDASPTNELERLKVIEKKYNDQLEEIEILKKFQAFLKENG